MTNGGRVDRRAFVAGAVAAAAAIAMPRPTHAAAYPDRPIRLVVPFPPGGPNDIVARLLGQKLTDALGQPIVVTNMPGASTVIGTRFAARAAADGYTLLMLSPSHVINPGLRADPSFDLLRDFAPIVEIVESPNVLVVNPATPVRTVAELVAYAKARPGQINYGSGGLGTATHMAGELLCWMSGVPMNHVSYKGDAPATTDLLGQQIVWKFGTILSVKQLVTSGRLRALAVSGPQRVAVLPDVPTVAETIPGFDATSLYGVAAPAKTPGDVIERLNAEMQKIVRMPDFVATLAADGGTPIGGSAEAFRARLSSSIDKWRTLIQEAHIKAD